jgi:hypothetical protein
VATFIWQYAVAPEAVRIDITRPTGSTFDFTTVTSADISVIESPDGSTPIWSATLSNQTATTVRLSHVFAAGETDVPGDFRLLPRLYVGSTMYRGVPLDLYCKAVKN